MVKTKKTTSTAFFHLTNRLSNATIRSMNPDRLVQLRKRTGLTQEGLARLLGVSRNTVARWEMGMHSISKLEEIAIRSVLEKLSRKGGGRGRKRAAEER